MTSETKKTIELCELADASAFGVESLSPFCLKTHRALQAAGVSYGRRFGAHPGVFKSHNPQQQVPVLLVDGRAIPDSTAILRWLVAEYPNALAATPEAWLWEELADTALNGFLVASRWLDEDNWPLVKAAYFVTMPAPVRAVVPALIRRDVRRMLHARDVWRAGPEACWSRLALLLDQLDARAPSQGYWCSETISVADVALYGQLQSMRTSLTQKQRDWVQARPRLTAYLDRLASAAATRSLRLAS